MKRIAITGLGHVSALGTNIESAWSNLLSGKCAISKVKGFEYSDLKCQIGAQIHDFNVEPYISSKDARRMDTFMHYGIAAAIQAIEDAKLDDHPIDKDRVGVSIGSGIGGLNLISNTAIQTHEEGIRKIGPFFIPGCLINLVSGHVSIIKGYKASNFSLVSACSTAAHSIGEAAKSILLDETDVMIAGGAEAAICRLSLAGFSSMKALSLQNDNPQIASRPFDKNRDGFVMGDGAGVIVLEEYNHALKRGATIHAELVGYAATSDASHITAPNKEGPAKAMSLALKRANIKSEEVGYINAHGTSTPLGDANECAAIKEVFKDHAYNLIVNSTKSMTGHLLGAAGGVEAIYSILALKNQISPPTINLDEPDLEKGCDLNFSANSTTKLQTQYAISNSFGFGGTNATLVFKKA